MVEKGIVIDTIKKMYASGLDDSIIANTLKDIGLNEKEIREIMAEAKGQAPRASFGAVSSGDEAGNVEPANADFHERIAAATAQKVQQQLNSQREEDALVHATTHAAITGYESQLNEIVDRLVLIERKLNSIAGVSDFSAKAASLDRKVSTMESDVSELKAISNALKSLLEKVLDTDRSILANLEEKK